MVTYTIQTGDILLCDINSYISGGVVTIPTYSTYTGGLCFNFKKGANVTKQLDKTVYTIRKPGVPVGYEIGLGERFFNVTATIKKPEASYAIGQFQSLLDLNYLCNYQYNRNRTLNDAGGSITATPSYGILNYYYYGDKVQNTFYKVMVKNMWYNQIGGGGTMFDVRIALTEVSPP